MKFRQLLDPATSTYTYLIASSQSGEALVIDPVFGQLERDLLLLKELGLKLRYALDTHVHADHVSSLGVLRERTGCETVMSSASGVDCADIKVVDGDSLRLEEIIVNVIETPGHTKGCVSYKISDRVFTGDALLVRGCGRTDFQEGDAGLLYDSITQKLFSLSDETLVYPGHDYRGFSFSTVGEERKFNPRLTLPKESFLFFMKQLVLPHPKNMAEAVPVNSSCGKGLQDALS
jgi:sulfur dioxygenase